MVWLQFLIVQNTLFGRFLSEPIATFCCFQVVRCGVIVVLQWCYGGFAVVLWWCYGGATVLLWCCYGGVIVVLWLCYGGVMVSFVVLKSKVTCAHKK